MRPTMNAIGDPLTISTSFGDYDGEVAVVVIDGNGDPVAEGFATGPEEEGPLLHTFDLPVQTAPALLRATFTAADGRFRTGTAEITGSDLFTDDQVRAMKVAGVASPLSSVENYSPEVVAHWRALITELFEQRTRRSWVSRWCRAEVRATGSRTINLKNGKLRTAGGVVLDRPGALRNISTIRSVSINGTPIDPDTVAIDGHRLVRQSGLWPTPPSNFPNVVVEYEYGDQAVSWEASENGLRMVAANAVKSSIDSRATSFSNEDGTFRVSTYPVAVEEWMRSQTLWSPLL